MEFPSYYLISSNYCVLCSWWALVAGEGRYISMYPTLKIKGQESSCFICSGHLTRLPETSQNTKNNNSDVLTTYGCLHQWIKWHLSKHTCINSVGLSDNVVTWGAWEQEVRKHTKIKMEGEVRSISYVLDMILSVVTAIYICILGGYLHIDYVHHCNGYQMDWTAYNYSKCAVFTQLDTCCCNQEGTAALLSMEVLEVCIRGVQYMHLGKTKILQSRAEKSYCKCTYYVLLHWISMWAVTQQDIPKLKQDASGILWRLAVIHTECAHSLCLR